MGKSVRAQKQLIYSPQMMIMIITFLPLPQGDEDDEDDEDDDDDEEDDDDDDDDDDDEEG